MLKWAQVSSMPDLKSSCKTSPRHRKLIKLNVTVVRGAPLILFYKATEWVVTAQFLFIHIFGKVSNNKTS